jgi:hypothetical protein
MEAAFTEIKILIEIPMLCMVSNRDSTSDYIEILTSVHRDSQAWRDYNMIVIKIGKRKTHE